MQCMITLTLEQTLLLRISSNHTGIIATGACLICCYPLFLIRLDQLAMSRVGTGRPPATPSENSEETSQQGAEPIDLRKQPDIYFATLDKLVKHSNKVRQHDAAREAKELEYTTLTEQFNMGKEGKVLSRWQERQRDWEKIQNRIGRRIAASKKDTRPLMMAVTDEFRARVEEYDLIQAATPVIDRHSSQSWKMTLRGGGPIRVAIGHIFSGIECEFEITHPNPKMIRKPKPPNQTFKNDTFVEPTPDFVAKQTRYAKNIATIRPHNLTYTDAVELMVTSKPLFEWAKESSEAVINQEKLPAIEEESDSVVENISLVSASHAEEDNVISSKHLLGPIVEFLTPREIVLVATVGKSSSQKVQFRNTGSTALTYKWKRIDNIPPSTKNRPDTPSNADDVFPLKAILTRKGDDNGALRVHKIATERLTFFCGKDSGSILPDDIVTTTFTFNSANGGSFRNEWQLEFSPGSARILVVSPEVSSVNRPNLTGMITVNLHGHATEPDETKLKRSNVAAYLRQCSTDSVAFDIIQDCIRRVRDPVRIHDLEERRVALFRNVNKDVLQRVSTRYGSLLPLFITPERLDLFAALNSSSIDFYQAVNDTLQHLKDEIKAEKSFAVASGEEKGSDAAEEGLVAAASSGDYNPFIIQKDTISKIQNLLFPERIIEVFDEITADQLRPSWDYSVAALLEKLATTLDMANEVAVLEVELKILTAAREKAERKAEAAAAARKAAGDDDDDEEEEEEEEDEEEEEEEEEEEDEAVEKPVHLMVQQTNVLIDSVRGVVQLLVVRPATPAAANECFKSGVTAMLDSIPDCYDKAMDSAGIAHIVAANPEGLHPLPSAFATEEGSAAWLKVLATTSAVEEIVDPKAKKAAAKPKGKDKNAVEEITERQRDFFYHELFNAVKESILENASSSFAQLNETARTQSDGILESFGTSGAQLMDVAVLRSDDIATSSDESRGSVAFVNFNGDAFANVPMPSAFAARNAKQSTAVEPLIQLVEGGAQAIVLLYEPSSANQMMNVNDIELLPGMADIKIVLSSELKSRCTKRDEELIKYNKKNRIKTPVVPSLPRALDFVGCASAADLNYHLDRVLKIAQQRDSAANAAAAVPVLVVENLSRVGVIPEEPEYKEEESDEDEPALSIGASQSKAKKLAKWNARRPHRVSRNVTTVNKSMTKIECFADRTAAVKEAFDTARELQFIPLWVEANAGRIFCDDAISGFQQSLIVQRLVSGQVREACVWTGVLQLLPQAGSLILEGTSAANGITTSDDATATAAAATSEAKSNDMVTDEQQAGAGEYGGGEVAMSHAAVPEPLVGASLLSKHFCKLFPFSAQSATAAASSSADGVSVAPLQSVAVIGGVLSADKFRVIDQLVDLVDVLFIVGQVCVPFIGLSSHIEMKRYKSEICEHKLACRSLVAKARARGCKLVWPVDAVVADEKLKDGETSKCFEKVDAESRGEGADYEGEAKQMSLLAAASVTAGGEAGDNTETAATAAASGPSDYVLAAESNEAAEAGVPLAPTPPSVFVDGYIYDIGSETCTLLADYVSNVDLLFVWGTVGVCEMSSFQAGQTALVNAAARKPLDLETKPAEAPLLHRNPLQSLLIGDSNVEWWTRLTDSDGELQGDIVGFGVVTYASRESAAIVGLLGLYPASVITKELCKRPALETEWVYSTTRDYIEEEEEDEDDADEDED